LDSRSGFKLSSETFIVPILSARLLPTCDELHIPCGAELSGNRLCGADHRKSLCLLAVGTFVARFHPEHAAVLGRGNFFHHWRSRCNSFPTP
jgi:hypothetical protein